MSSSAVQQVSASMSAIGTTTSFTSNPLGQVSAAAIPRSFFDDGNSEILTWNKLVDNMRRSIELYGQAINNADRSEYVRRAEDISDHLRMLLAAASGTTDNHSGYVIILSYIPAFVLLLALQIHVLRIFQSRDRSQSSAITRDRKC